MRRQSVQPTIAVDAGRRDRRVTLQSRTSSVGSSSFPVETWADLDDNVFAHRQDVQYDENFRTDQTTASVHTRWEIPYRADMDPETINLASERRLVHESRVYDIVSGVPVGRMDAIELITLARTG